MIKFPNCKINLGLHITAKRADGYHDLQTIFFPVPLLDAVEILPTKKNTTSIQITGIPFEGDPSQNLCIRAWQMLREDFPTLPPVNIHLHKAIPAGAGLGGGSADAVATLLLLNEKFDLKISDERLHQFAMRLGSDCPFFLLNRPCYAEGRGEVLQPIELDLSDYAIVLVNPGIHITTAQAFSMIQPTIPEKSLREIIAQPIVTWKEELKNDFESAIFRRYPAIAEIKDQLYQAGAIYASMSGSGSTVYGLFPNRKIPQLEMYRGYFVRYLNENTLP